MTVSELYEQVAKLGFEDSLEDGKSFYHSANRALVQVGAIRPAIGACVINHNPPKNLLGDSSFSPVERTNDLSYEAEGAKAFYFEADGEGHYFVECFDGTSWEKIGDGEMSSSERKFLPYKGLIRKDGEFVSGRVRLRFSGEYLCYVRRVALYGSVYSAKQSDVPEYAPLLRYNIPLLADDFVSFADPPVGEDRGYDRKRDRYEIEGDSILLPYAESGVVRVLYNRKRRALAYTVDPSTDDTVIDLDHELAALLPVLVAAYVWLEDEEEKASYYMNLYRERAAEVERRSRKIAPAVVKNVYGW